MIYNSTDVCGVPWEPIIKSFRRNLGHTTFDELAGYCDSFFRFLQTNPVLFPQDRQLIGILVSAAKVFVQLVPRITSQAKARDGFEQEISELEKLDPLDCLPMDAEQQVLQSYEAQFDNAAKIIFKRPSYLKNNKRRYRRLASLALTRKRLLSDYTGIVFAGFGEAEIFPSIREVVVDGVLLDRVRCHAPAVHTVNETHDAEVVGFAQTEMIRTILEGVNPRYDRLFHDEVISLVRGLPREVLRQVSQLNSTQRSKYIRSASQGAVDALLKLLGKMEAERTSAHTDPIKEAIGVMPLAELATVAEVLVNLAQIRQRMSLKTETVGGPIDVAVISKSGGLVWIKRKHYFEGSLNPQFLVRYSEV